MTVAGRFRSVNILTLYDYCSALTYCPPRILTNGSFPSASQSSPPCLNSLDTRALGGANDDSSILITFSYSLYFPGFLVGPYLDFSSYMALVDGSLFSSIERNEKSAALKKGMSLDYVRCKLLSNVCQQVASSPLDANVLRTASFSKVSCGLVSTSSLVASTTSESRCSRLLSASLSGTGKVLPYAILSKSLTPFRIALFQVCGLFERAKYYALWTLTEGASILTGSGFTGYGPDGASLWEGAANVDVKNIELGPNFKVSRTTAPDFAGMLTTCYQRSSSINGT